ncbi:hypothetical protein AAFX24_27595 [Vibrio mediterranei]|uniref:hypothetical protein n=1 Tax=Vibrio mediterranei TaxID=689 RepID=UPI0038CEB4C9
MKMDLSDREYISQFRHSRSGSCIDVVSSRDVVMVRFISQECGVATVALEDMDDVARFESAFYALVTDKERHVQGWFFDDVVLSISRDTWGEPFEETIRLNFTQADPERPWDAPEVSVNLSLDQMDSFLNSLSAKVRRKMPL